MAVALQRLLCSVLTTQARRFHPFGGTSPHSNSLISTVGLTETSSLAPMVQTAWMILGRQDFLRHLELFVLGGPAGESQLHLARHQKKNLEKQLLSKYSGIPLRRLITLIFKQYLTLLIYIQVRLNWCFSTSPIAKLLVRSCSLIYQGCSTRTAHQWTTGITGRI